jgi:hypothetical protein
MEDRDIAAEVAPSKVTTIHLNGYPSMFPIKANHWVIFLQFDKGDSVKVDMTPSADGETGCALFLLKDCISSSSAIHHRRWDTVGDVTVGQVRDMFKDNGLHRYKFNQTGQSCQYWVWSLFKEIEEMGYFHEGSEQEPWSDTSHVWYGGDEKELTGVGQGSVYRCWFSAHVELLPGRVFLVRSFCNACRLGIQKLPCSAYLAEILSRIAKVTLLIHSCFGG